MTLLLKSGWFRGVQALRDVLVFAQLEEDLGASGILATDLNGTTFLKNLCSYFLTFWCGSWASWCLLPPHLQLCKKETSKRSLRPCALPCDFSPLPCAQFTRFHSNGGCTLSIHGLSHTHTGGGLLQSGVCVCVCAGVAGSLMMTNVVQKVWHCNHLPLIQQK